MSDGVATRSQRTFRLAYAVQIHVDAPAERVWALLTDADGYPRWNGAVTSLRGPIAGVTKPISHLGASPCSATLSHAPLPCCC